MITDSTKYNYLDNILKNLDDNIIILILIYILKDNPKNKNIIYSLILLLI